MSKLKEVGQIAVALFACLVLAVIVLTGALAPVLFFIAALKWIFT